MSQYPAPYYPDQNPGSGAAAAGAAGGAVLGNLVSMAVVMAMGGEAAKDAALDVQKGADGAEIVEDMIKKARIAAGIGLVASTALASAGAHLAAPEGSKKQAAVGAGVGMALVKITGVIMPLLAILPGIGVSAAGAYIGSSR